MLGHLYYLDVYISVAKTAAERNFVFPKAFDKGQRLLSLKGLYHPLTHPVGNDITMGEPMPLVFLTGANMAGKSHLSALTQHGPLRRTYGISGRRD